MRDFIRYYLSVLLFAFLVCSEFEARAQKIEDSGTTVDGVAAFVNGEVVTIGDVYAGVRALLADSEWRAGRSQREAFNAAYKEALTLTIHQRLIVQEYWAGKVRLPEWLITKRQTEILESRFQGDHTALLRELANERMTIDDWRKRIEEQMIFTAMRQSHVNSNIRVSPGSILEYYNENKADFVSAWEVRLGLILLKMGAEESEESLLERSGRVAEEARAGSFGAVAEKYSDDPSASRGGDWGWIKPRETLRDELSEALSALPVGEVSAPVVTPFGCYILLKHEERSEGERPLAEVREEIESKLRDRQADKLLSSWIESLVGKASINVVAESEPEDDI